MQVILLRDVKKLGSKNSVINVKDGYAMNFLFPQKLAVAANADKIAQLDKEKEQTATNQEKAQAEVNKLAEQLKDKKLVLTEKASDKGKLYAAISPAEVIEAIKKQLKVNIEPGHLKMKDHIKEIGTHTVPVSIDGTDLNLNLEIQNK